MREIDFTEKKTTTRRESEKHSLALTLTFIQFVRVCVEVDMHMKKRSE